MAVQAHDDSLASLHLVDLPPDVLITSLNLLDLPQDVLVTIAALVLQRSGLAFGATCTAAQEALGRALCTVVPALAGIGVRTMDAWKVLVNGGAADV